MGANSKKPIWPFAFKTVAIDGVPAAPYPTYGLLGTYNLVNAENNNVLASELALEIFPPLLLYHNKGLYTHFNYTFNSGVSVPNQVVNGIYVRTSPPNTTYVYNNFVPLNIPAVAGTVNFSMDLSSMISPTGTLTVYVQFPGGVASSPANTGTVNMWKLDLLYQTIGVRDARPAT